MRGEGLGPLFGVPFSVKDLVNTAGVRTTFGSVAFADNVPSADSVAVARLKRAGAILIGKTTTPEFGHKPFTEAPLFGRTANAWDQSRTSGGSSGGAAVAVAAGLGPLAIGTDGGGSGRIPAACNGVVAFKQTLGLVPHDLTPDGFGNQSYIMPITRTVMDSALMLQAMAGPDPSDPHSLGLPAADFVAAARSEGDLKGLRIAWRPYLGNRKVAREVMALCEAAVAELGELGADRRADGGRLREHRAGVAGADPVVLERPVPPLCARIRGADERHPAAPDGRRRPLQRDGIAGGDVRAHPDLSRDPGLVPALRHDRDADLGAHGALRSTTISSPRSRSTASRPTPCARPGTPIPTRSISPATRR